MFISNKYILTVLIVVCMTQSSISQCALPERTIRINHNLDHITISDGTSGKAIYSSNDSSSTNSNQITDSQEKKKISLPAGVDICMSIQETRNNYEDNEKDNNAFKIKDIEYLSGQGENIIQDITLSKCSNNERLNEALFAIKNQKYLKSVYLYECKINADTFSCLQNLGRLDRIAFDHCSMRIDQSLNNPLSYIKCNSIIISFTPHLACLTDLSLNKYVEDISIHGESYDRLGIGIISANSNIKHFQLDLLEDDDLPSTKTLDFSFLHQFENLVDLSIILKSGLVRNYSFLRKLDRVKRLSLINSKIDRAGLTEISRLKNIEYLDLSQQGTCEPDDFMALGELPNLKTLLLVNATKPSGNVLRRLESKGIEIKFE